MTGFRLASTIAISAALIGGAALGARAQTIKDFEGRFVGTGVLKVNQYAQYHPVRGRDLNIVIKQTAGGGFVLTWTTAFRQRWYSKDAKSKTRTTTVNFKPAGKNGRWRGEGTGDLFGGKPVIWALLEGKSLYVHVVAINDKGGVVTASYKRTLTSGGMRLDFRATRNGDRVRVVGAALKRVK